MSTSEAPAPIIEETAQADRVQELGISNIPRGMLHRTPTSFPAGAQSTAMSCAHVQTGQGRTSAVECSRQLRDAVRSPRRERYSERMSPFGEFSIRRAYQQPATRWPGVLGRSTAPLATLSSSLRDWLAAEPFIGASIDPFRSRSSMTATIEVEREARHSTALGGYQPPKSTIVYNRAEELAATASIASPWRVQSSTEDAQLQVTAIPTIPVKARMEFAAQHRCGQGQRAVSEWPQPKCLDAKDEPQKALSTASFGDTPEAQDLIGLSSKSRNRHAWSAGAVVEETPMHIAKPEITHRGIWPTAPDMDWAGGTRETAVYALHGPSVVGGRRSGGPSLVPVSAGLEKRPSVHNAQAGIGTEAPLETPLAGPPVAPTPGTVASPFSPVIEAELFESESESINEPLYELSDTTILDVNPSLLLPLSGCNFFLIVVSTVLFLGSLYAYLEEEPTSASTSPNTWLVYMFLHLEIAFMAVALVVFVVASVGLLGALRENVTLLDTYSTLQGAFVSAEVVFVILVFFLPIIGREFVISHITTELIVYYRDNPDYRKEIDYVQSTLRCCGMTDNAYRDWNANAYFNCSPTNPSAERCSVPPSCCRRPEKAAFGLDDLIPLATQSPKDKKEKGDDIDDQMVMTTLCGRGVMKLKEQDAWKRIYTRGCGPAMFHYVESHVVEIVLFSLLVIIVHLMLMSLSLNVRKEINALSKVYDKYYKAVYRGQKRMKEMNVLDDDGVPAERPPQGPPLVASLAARKERHRRRYLRALPASKPQAAPQGKTAANKI